VQCVRQKSYHPPTPDQTGRHHPCKVLVSGDRLVRMACSLIDAELRAVQSVIQMTDRVLFGPSRFASFKS
jgi:hypothetical protein